MHWSPSRGSMRRRWQGTGTWCVRLHMTEPARHVLSNSHIQVINQCLDNTAPHPCQDKSFAMHICILSGCLYVPP
jgi:hypothetical protein